MFRHKKSLWLFLLPGLVGLLLFYVLPFIEGVRYSVTDGSVKNAFVGLNNYRSIWQNPMFLLGLRNTMLFSAICAPLVWLLSFVIAAMLKQIQPGGAFFRNSILMPYLMPSSAILLIWLLFFDYGGMFNRMITACGMDRVFWLQGSNLRLPIILMFVWKNLGFAVIIWTAALQAIPEPLYEFARLEGGGFFFQTFHITLPMVIPTAFLVIILEWINAFRIFKEVYFIGGAYPEEAVYTLQNYMNNMYGKLNYQNVTTAAYSFAIIVFALFGALFASQHALLRRFT